jgi:hypothetical protein
MIPEYLAAAIVAAGSRVSRSHAEDDAPAKMLILWTFVKPIEDDMIKRSLVVNAGYD